MGEGRFAVGGLCGEIGGTREVSDPDRLEIAPGWRECACPLLRVGGCRYVRLLREGHMGGANTSGLC